VGGVVGFEVGCTTVAVAGRVTVGLIAWVGVGPAAGAVQAATARQRISVEASLRRVNINFFLDKFNPTRYLLYNASSSLKVPAS
jgi:hypothetical protein